MKRTRIIYWGIAGTALATGLGLSVVKSGDRWEFNWDGAELMAQTSQNAPHDLAALQITNRVLLQLQENYVDTDRLDPVTMLAESLDAVQKVVPELLIVFDKPKTEHPTTLTATIGDKQRTFSLDSITNLWEMSLRLREVLLFVQNDFPTDVKPRDLEYTLINGMLKTLDPHSVILSPEVYKDMQEGNQGKFGGLGIVVRMVDGVLVIINPMEGEPPAVKAGLKAGDQILAIDGTPTLNMNVSDAVEMLKGEPNTTVKLTVQRKGWKAPKIIDVVREEIQIPSTTSDDLGDHVAYVKLKGFQANSQTDMIEALKKLTEKMGVIEGLVLDLRGNPGGLLDQAVQIADDFLSSGTIVTTVGQSDALKKPYNATIKTTQPGYPIVLLIDSSSASASEIVAGALQNNDRALVLGDTSFGKGSVQVLYELPDKSALKMTIAQYLTPGDRSIQSVGIVPDIHLVPMLATADTFDLYPRPWERRESSLDSHLDNQRADKQSESPYALRYLSNRIDLESEMDEETVLTLDDIDKYIATQQKEDSPSKDPQVRLAKRILRLMKPTQSSRADMLKTYAPNADEISRDEAKALIDQLATFNIDWSEGTNPAPDTITSALKLDLKTKCVPGKAETARCDAPVDDDATHTYLAGEQYKVEATLTNTSSETLYRLAARTESSFNAANDEEFIFGTIAPGQSVTRELTLKTNRAQASRRDNFKVTVYADDGTPIPKTELINNEIFLTTQARPQPKFTLSYAILDEIPNTHKRGNALLDDNEKVTVRVWVTNAGDGTAEKPLVYLKNGDKKSVIRLTDARSETEALAPGQTITRDFTFETDTVTAETVPLELHIYDKTSTQVLVENIGFITAKNDDIKVSTSLPVTEYTTAVAPDTPLYVSPTTMSAAIQTFTTLTRATVDAEVADFVHIVSGDVLGWVKRDQLRTDDTDATNAQVTTITTIPRITIDPAMPLSTQDDKITLKARFDASQPLKDCYIYVFSMEDHTLQSTKVAYDKLAPDATEYTREVPIKPGVNRVRLFVRDQKNSEAYETIQVYRNK